MKLILFGGVFVVLLAAGSFLIASNNQSLGQKPLTGRGVIATTKNAPGAIPEVQVAKPIRRDVAATLRLPATVSPYHQTTLYAKVSGYLKTIAVDKGDRVKAGQVLAVIDDPELGQRLQQAQSDYEIKKVTYERLANVRKENPDVIAKQDVDLAEAAYQGSTHALEQLVTMLDYTKVRAPYSGVITARFVDPGALIQAATSSATQSVPLFTIMDMSTLRFYINVPQEDASYVHKGSGARIMLKDGRSIDATVTRSTMALDPGTRTLLAEIDVRNEESSLAPGMFAEVVLDLRSHQGALVVPPAALVSEGTSKAVFIVENGVVRKVPIKTDIDDGVWVEVTSGLSGDEEVVVVGKSRVSDGAKVNASPSNLPAGKPASQKY